MNTQDKSMFTSNVHGVNIPWTLTPYKPPLKDGGIVVNSDGYFRKYENQQIMNYDGSSFTVRMSVPSPMNTFTHLRVESLGMGKFYRILNIKTLAAGVSEFTCVFDPIVYIYTPDVYKDLQFVGWQTGTINEDDHVLNAVDGLTPIYKTIYQSPAFTREPRLFVKMKGSMRDFNDLALPLTNTEASYDTAGGTTSGFTAFGGNKQIGGPSNTTTGIIYECTTDNINPSHIMAGFAKDLKHTGKVVDAWMDQRLTNSDYEPFESNLSITLPSGKSVTFASRKSKPTILKSFEIYAAGDQLNDKARDNKYIRVTVGMTTIDISYNDIFWTVFDSDQKYGYNSMIFTVVYVPATSSEGGMIQVISSTGDTTSIDLKSEESDYADLQAAMVGNVLGRATRLLASIPLEVVPIGIYGYGWSEYIQRQKFQMADEMVTNLTTSLIDIFSKGAIQLSEMTYNIDTSATGKDNTKANQGGISTPTHITNDVNMTRILTSSTDIVKNSDGTITTTKATYSIPKNDNEDGSNTDGAKNQSNTSSAATTNQSQLDRATQTVKSESTSKSIGRVPISSKVANGIFKMLKIGLDVAAQWQDALSTPLAGGDSHGTAYFDRVVVSRAEYRYKNIGWNGVPKYEQDIRERNLMVILNNPARTMNSISYCKLDNFKCKSTLSNDNDVYYIEGKFTLDFSLINAHSDSKYRLSPQETTMVSDMFKDGFYIGL